VVWLPTCSLAALSVYYGFYMSEVYRAGFESVSNEANRTRVLLSHAARNSRSSDQAQGHAVTGRVVRQTPI